MIANTKNLPACAEWIECWHCATCDVIFDRTSADLSGDVIACPRCGRVNLGYVGGPSSPATEEIEVIDDPKPDTPAPPAARGSEKFTSTDELVDLLTPELERFKGEADAALAKLERAKREVQEANAVYGKAQNTYTRLNDFLAQIRQEPPLPRGSAQRG